jgi:hypothetical protein
MLQANSVIARARLTDGLFSIAQAPIFVKFLVPPFLCLVLTNPISTSLGRSK